MKVLFFCFIGEEQLPKTAYRGNWQHRFCNNVLSQLCRTESARTIKISLFWNAYIEIALKNDANVTDK